MVRARIGQPPNIALRRTPLAALVGLALLVAGFAAGQPFAPSCTIPFDSIAVHHPIDSSCGFEGDASGDPPHAAQNRAKNNLCVTGAPAVVTFLSFKKLQQKVDLIPGAKGWTRTNLPHDRSILAGIYTTSDGATIGEGSVVRLVAWLFKLRKGGAESVNCQGTTKDEIDMHLVLTPKNGSATDECSSATAELIPHLRPASWDGQTLLSAIDHPFRFTGHLMYDAAHRPCSGSPPKAGASAPARTSSWEIHPVYGIEVCKFKTLTKCKAGNDSVWTALDQWSGS